jgi:hypothetical protein
VVRVPSRTAPLWPPAWLAPPPSDPAPADRPTKTAKPAPADFTPEAVAEALGPWPPRAPELSAWPTALRERWGRRSGELQAVGQAWNEAERLAFAEILGEQIRARLDGRAPQ